MIFVSGIVGLNNIKANDYCNVVLQVRLSILFNESDRQPKINLLNSPRIFLIEIIDGLLTFTIVMFDSSLGT